MMKTTVKSADIYCALAFIVCVTASRWWRGVVANALVVINQVTVRRARLVLGRVNHLVM